MNIEKWAMRNEFNIGSIMTTQVIYISPTETMDKVRAIFEEHNIHHIPVVDEQKVVGMISKSVNPCRIW